MSSSVTTPALRILVVEDHRDTLDIVASYLESLGCSVEGVGSVAEALSKLADDRWDMLLSDISLPDGTGWDILEETSAKVFAVSMSAHIRAGVKTKSLTAGFILHIEKPLTPSDLDAAVDECRAWWNLQGWNGCTPS